MAHDLLWLPLSPENLSLAKKHGQGTRPPGPTHLATPLFFLHSRKAHPLPLMITFLWGGGGGRRGIFELIIKRKAGAKGVMGRREKVKRHCTFSLSHHSPPALLACPQLSRISQLNLGKDCGGGSF